jgi:hypothetical protein
VRYIRIRSGEPVVIGSFGPKAILTTGRQPQKTLCDPQRMPRQPVQHKCARGSLVETRENYSLFSGGWPINDWLAKACALRRRYRLLLLPQQRRIVHVWRFPFPPWHPGIFVELIGTSCPFPQANAASGTRQPLPPMQSSASGRHVRR